MDFIQIAKNAKNASLKIADLSTEIKNKALLKIAEKIESAKDEIFEANKVDLELAQTLPVGYTSCLSMRQAEDVLGDGWTVDVIAWIFGFLNEYGE